MGDHTGKQPLELSTMSSPRHYSRGSRADHNLRARRSGKQTPTLYGLITICLLPAIPCYARCVCGEITALPSELGYPVGMAEAAWVEQQARAMLEFHGLAGSWSFGWDRAKTRFGQCDHQHHRITLSRYLCEEGTTTAVEQVLLHEIAHALAGSRAGHGAKWRSIASSIGYLGGRTHSASLDKGHARWTGSCPGGHEIMRYRKPGKPVSCAKCDRRFNTDHVIVWSESPDYSSTLTSFQKET